MLKKIWKYRENWKVVAVALVVILIVGLAGKFDVECATASTTTPTVEEPQYVYIICDVVDFDIESGELYCLIPNGEVEIYCAYDLPLECELCCLRTTNQNDYTTYEVVAIR